MFNHFVKEDSGVSSCNEEGGCTGLYLESAVNEKIKRCFFREAECMIHPLFRHLRSCDLTYSVRRSKREIRRGSSIAR